METLKDNKKNIPSHLIKVKIAGIIGTAMEIYDFTLYGVFATEIAKLFFPQYDSFFSLLASLGVFACGFIMRPLGGIVFGHIGDLFGRRLALSISILIMSLVTLIIGLIPTYSQIGITASIILILCRLIQGLSAGGEYIGACIFTIEHFNKRKDRAFATALIPAAGALGAFLAMFFGSITLATIEEGWRIPFLLGACLGLIGLYIRRNVPETPAFVNKTSFATCSTTPIVILLRHYRNAVLCTIGIGGTQSALSYAVFTYVNLYLTQTIKISEGYSMLLNSLGILIYMISLPFLGILVDKVDYKKAMIVGALMPILFIYPIFLLLSTGNITCIIIAQTLFGLTLAGFVAPVNVFMNELFIAEIRYSGIAFGYGIGSAILGGTFPLIASYCTETFNNELFPAFYLFFCSIIGLCSVIWGISIQKVNYSAIQS